MIIIINKLIMINIPTAVFYLTLIYFKKINIRMLKYNKFKKNQKIILIKMNIF